MNTYAQGRRNLGGLKWTRRVKGRLASAVEGTESVENGHQFFVNPVIGAAVNRAYLSNQEK